MQIHKVERQIGGRTLTIEVGRMAKQAMGSALVSFGETMVLAAVVTEPARPGLDFFPLTVDYREKPSSAGKIPGGFFKREGRPTTKEILTMRLTDRPIRPLFPDGFSDEVQIHVNVLSFDGANDPGVLSIVASSAALSVSPIPFKGPAGAVRVGYIGGQYVINPEQSQLPEAELLVVVAGRRGAISMVEGSAREVSEDVLIGALEKGQEAIEQIVALQEELVRLVGVPEKKFEDKGPDAELVSAITSKWGDKILEAIRTEGKFPRRDAIRVFQKEAVEALVAKNLPESEVRARKSAVDEAFELVRHRCHRKIILSGKRADGRGYAEVRQISGEVSVLPRVHGSALFTRGETQVLAQLTLGSIEDEQRIDGIIDDYRKTFMLHYNFPSFAVGEVKPIRGPGRREIGHGDLAERSLLAVMPTWEEFPYTMRVVADVLESNGSSSMGSVCATTMSLMDGGVPLKKPVAGIAMGLLVEGGKTCILTDILGDEDHHGDMDFKIAGTKDGITGFQMDIKVEGVSRDVMQKALAQARDGRIHILGEMEKTISATRGDISKYAPAIRMLRIPVDKIGRVIGPGGKMINKIQNDWKVDIDVEDDGRLVVSGLDRDGIEKARAFIEGIVTEAQVGMTYKGVVTGVKDFGAFVEILPGTEGMIHVSELGLGYVDKASDVVKEGDEMEVKVINVDDSGKIKLSRRGMPGFDAERPPGEGGDRGRSGGSGGRPSRPRSSGGGSHDRGRSGGSGGSGGDRPRPRSN